MYDKLETEFHRILTYSENDIRAGQEIQRRLNTLLEKIYLALNDSRLSSNERVNINNLITSCNGLLEAHQRENDELDTETPLAQPPSNLRTWVTTDPDLSGETYYVEVGTSFNPDHFAQHSNLNSSLFDEIGVQAAIIRSAKLTNGEWMGVEFQNR